MKSLRQYLRLAVTRAAARYTSKPDKERVHEALTKLRLSITNEPGKKGPVIDLINYSKPFIIFSDQHKGAKNGADDFAGCEANYVAALDHYHQQNYHLVCLGDSEELWENNLEQVVKNNPKSFEKERMFLTNGAFTKIFGNHDLYWDNALTASNDLEKIYGIKVPVYEGLILQTIAAGLHVEIFLTHGHQGDLISDGNAFSKWFVSNIWARLQGYLNINPNTPAYDDQLKTTHNKMMYEWSALQTNTILITGHTHQPVFESLTHLERLYRSLMEAAKNKNTALEKKLTDDIALRRREGDTIPDFTAFKPCYFNSGCCCYADRDITGIEIESDFIRLIKWKLHDEKPVRVLLEEMPLAKCF